MVVVRYAYIGPACHYCFCTLSWRVLLSNKPVSLMDYPKEKKKKKEKSKKDSSKKDRSKKKKNKSSSSRCVYLERETHCRLSLFAGLVC